MAQQPSWIKKVNFITKFISNPCHASWYLYFETALTPTGHLVVALLSFGMDDVIRGYFRPKNLRTMRHGRKGKRGKKRRFEIPEIGEEIGKHLPGAERARGRSVSQGVKNFWIIDGVLQRLLFWWMVIDVTTDFFFEWMSAIQKEAHCSAQNAAGFAAEGGEQIILGIVGWDFLLAGIEHYEQNGAQWDLSGGSVPEGDYTFVVAGKVRASPNAPAPTFTARIIIDGPDGGIYSGQPVSLSTLTPSDFVVSCTFRGPSFMQAQASTFFGNAIVEEVHVFCQGTGPA